MISASPRHRVMFACSAAVVLAGLVYVNALHNPFVYDDRRTIVGNGTIVNLHDLRSIVLHDASRPLVNFSYAIDYHLWGSAPFGFHLTNVLLHMLNVALLFLLARRLVDDWRERRRPAAAHPVVDSTAAAFVAAALFAVHPMMTEAVGYVSGRPDVLCATCFLAALLPARRWMRAGGAGWWVLAAFWWIAALLSKEIAIVFPAVLLACDRLVSGDIGARARRRRLLGLHVPLATAALLAALARVAVFARLEHPNGLGVRWLSIVGEMDVLRRYVALLLAPAGQTIFHDVPPVSGILEAHAIAGIAVLAVLVALAWALRHLDGVASLGLIWFLCLVVPSAALFVLGQGQAMAEHRVYLASCGLFLAAGSALGAIPAKLASMGAGRRVPWIAGALCASAILSLSGRTLLRNAIWASPVTLWQEAVDRAPDHWFPLTVLGESLSEAGRLPEAVRAYRIALHLRPTEELGYIKLALCLADLGRLEEAIAVFEPLETIHPQSTAITTGLGMVWTVAHDPDRARGSFRETIERDPRDVMARQWLASIEEETNPTEALRLCEEIQQLRPGERGNDECVARTRARLAAAAAGGR